MPEPVISPRAVSRGLRHLRAADPVLAAVIKQVGPFRLLPNPDTFHMLLRSIVSQQISSRAAAAVAQRLEAQFAPDPVTAAGLLALEAEQIRAAGLSGRKTEYLRDLADHVHSGRLDLARLPLLPDDEIIREITAIRGIGVWTAHMMLMFSLGRLDVLPVGDYGIRVALRNLYALPDLPNPAECRRIAAPWHPYATIASWYCWRSLEKTG